VRIDDKTPQQLRALGITPGLERMNQEDVEHHGPGPWGAHTNLLVPPPINAPPGASDDSGRMTHEEGAGDVAVPVPSAAPAGRVDVYVWADPNGVPIIVRTDGTGVNLPQGGGAPDPGKTLGRP
jgi:hypothetical protein